MRVSQLLYSFLFIFVLSAQLPAAEVVVFSPKGDILGTKYRYGILNVDDKGVKSAAIAISLDKSKKYHALFSDSSNVKQANYTLAGISAAGDLIALSFIQNDNAYNNHVVLISIKDDNPQVIDQIGGAELDGLTYNFATDVTPISSQKKLISRNRDGVYQVEADFPERQFRLALEFSSAGIKVDLASPRYRNSIQGVDASMPLDEYQFREYLLYSVITSKLTYKDAMSKMEQRNSKESNLRPIIIDQAAAIKKQADALKIGGDLLVAYFSGQTGLEDLRKILSADDPDKADGFIELITIFEVELSKIGIDEVIFNDFAEFFLGKLSESDLKKYVERSLSSIGGDISSILAHYKDINKAIHNTKTRFYVKEFYGK